MASPSSKAKILDQGPLPAPISAFNGDWLDAFLDYTDGIPTPQIFRQWAGIAAVGAALERRVWARTRRSALYPNLYTLLVSPPGVGKSQAVAPVQNLWYETRKVKVSPDNMTRASFVDDLGASQRMVQNKGSLMQFCSMAVACSELGVLLPANDIDFLSILNHIFDCPRNYRESRRSLGKEIEIINPQLNILAASQPGFMADIFPERAWSGGFTSRLIMIYAGETPYVDIFAEEHEDKTAFTRCLDGMVQMTDLIGQVAWTQAAKEEISSWARSGQAPEPNHSKLEHYNKRRLLHVIKLSMIAAVSRSMDITIDLEDVVRARGWLLEAERFMPDIFRQMRGRSDSQVLEELHIWMHAEHSRTRKALHLSRIYNFLSNHLPSEKIQKIIEVAERANMMARVAGTEDQYIPKHKNQHGME